MKRLMIAAALALLTTTAHADDLRVAKGMMLASLYDRDCEKIPNLKPMIQQMLAEIPASTVQTGMTQASAYYRSMATPDFCKIMKPQIMGGP